MWASRGVRVFVLGCILFMGLQSYAQSRTCKSYIMGLPAVFAGYTSNHCAKFDGDQMMIFLIQSLADKLSYSYEEMCYHTRILDIFSETKQVYHIEDDSYHTHQVITLHYNEYSCEYQYDLFASEWSKQYCYGTF